MIIQNIDPLFVFNFKFSTTKTISNKNNSFRLTFTYIPLSNQTEPQDIRTMMTICWLMEILLYERVTTIRHFAHNRVHEEISIGIVVVVVAVAFANAEDVRRLDVQWRRPCSPMEIYNN